MKNYNELSYDEQKEVATLFANWLMNYTNEVVTQVMTRAEEIYNDEHSMKLLKELYEREQKEEKEYVNKFAFLLSDYDEFAKFGVHNNCLTHSEAYREVLYDMYIK